MVSTEKLIDGCAGIEIKTLCRKCIHKHPPKDGKSGYYSCPGDVRGWKIFQCPYFKGREI